MRPALADREPVIKAFLTAQGWGGARRRPLAGDASFRRYERLADGARRAVLMDAPPPRENVAPFVGLARHLCHLGFSAPEIYAAAIDDGLLLIEDFGDGTFASLLDGGADAESLFGAAVDVLADLHRRPTDEAVPADLDRLDSERLIDEACLLTDWFMPALFDRPTPTAVRASFRDAWHVVLDDMEVGPPTLVLKDFFAENLMWLDDRPGLAACGLLDFQDALAGPAAYDLVSLLEDERRDMEDDLARRLKARYRSAVPGLDGAAFETAYVILGAQRHSKNIGIFTRLCVRDGKAAYLDHIPRMWRWLERGLGVPVLSPVAAWFDSYVPAEARIVPPCRTAAQ